MYLDHFHASLVEKVDQAHCFSLSFHYAFFNSRIARNSFLASGNFCRLLITFANSLDPDQD